MIGCSDYEETGVNTVEKTILRHTRTIEPNCEIRPSSVAEENGYHAKRIRALLQLKSGRTKKKPFQLHSNRGSISL